MQLSVTWQTISGHSLDEKAKIGCNGAVGGQHKFHRHNSQS